MLHGYLTGLQRWSELSIDLSLSAMSLTGPMSAWQPTPVPAAKKRSRHGTNKCHAQNTLYPIPGPP